MSERENVVVVGSTGAMGQVITRRLAQAGQQVVAVARSADAPRIRATSSSMTRAVWSLNSRCSTISRRAAP
mgnify:CR=1 FL=1